MKAYTQLSQEERYTLCMFLAKGFSKVDIAKAMDRSPSTIYRELKRYKRTNGYYCEPRSQGWQTGEESGWLCLSEAKNYLNNF